MNRTTASALLFAILLSVACNSGTPDRDATIAGRAETSNESEDVANSGAAATDSRPLAGTRPIVAVHAGGNSSQVYFIEPVGAGPDGTTYAPSHQSYAYDTTDGTLSELPRLPLEQSLVKAEASATINGVIIIGRDCQGPSDRELTYGCIHSSPGRIVGLHYNAAQSKFVEITLPEEFRLLGSNALLPQPVLGGHSGSPLSYWVLTDDYNNVSALFKLDTATMEWTEITNLLPARSICQSGDSLIGLRSAVARGANPALTLVIRSGAGEVREDALAVEAEPVGTADKRPQEYSTYCTEGDVIVGPPLEAGGGEEWYVKALAGSEWKVVSPPAKLGDRSEWITVQLDQSLVVTSLSTQYETPEFAVESGPAPVLVLDVMDGVWRELGAVPDWQSRLEMLRAGPSSVIIFPFSFAPDSVEIAVRNVG